MRQNRVIEFLAADREGKRPTPPGKTLHGADANARDDRQQSPLHLAAGNGHADFAHLLIEKSADPNARDDHQWTPLHWAAARGHAAVARMLIAVGANLDLQNDNRGPALIFASRNDQMEIVKLLLNEMFSPERWYGREQEALALYDRLPSLLPDSYSTRLPSLMDLTPLRRNGAASSGNGTSAVDRYKRRESRPADR